MPKKTVQDVNLAGQVVLCRVDFNVPMEEGKITDDSRIQAALKTIKHLNRSRLILCSHMGRPKGQVVPKYSLAPCAARLGELLGREIPFVSDCVGAPVTTAVAGMAEGDLILLENTRFHAGEEAKDKQQMLAFARELATPASAFVNDAFGSSHRKHASVYGVTHFLSPCVAGFLVDQEVKMLRRIYDAPQEGFVVVLGGAKVEDKIDVIKSLLPRCEKMLIGGAMSWAFFKAQGMEIGESLCDDKSVELANEILAGMGQYLDRMMLPVDVNMQNVAGDHSHRIVSADRIQPGWDAQDVGPETASLYSEAVRQASNVFWNGPMGHFELKPFDQGTLAIAQAMGECTGFSVVGGGDSVAAVRQMGLADKMDHVSTGGGASLEFLVDGSLPAVEVLDDK